MRGKLAALSVLIFLIIEVRAQNEHYKPSAAIKCGSSQKCPEAWPCCSPYGECGAGPICLGSCNPRFSYNETSCAPMPALVPPNTLEYAAAPLTFFDGNETIQQLKSRGFLHFNKYLISDNNEEARHMLENIDFTYSGSAKIQEETGGVLLAMPKSSSGCLLAATKSFLYGKSAVRLKTGRSQGVITSIVIMSAVGDEIDFEFRGGDLEKVQSNYYYRGELVYNKMEEVVVSSDTWANYHDYEIDWSEDRINWIIDGEIVRTLEKADTWDESLKIFKYPETPMRLEIALWPGGSEKNHPGTISWAGGPIDWETSPDIIEKGQFSAEVQSMEVTPYSNRYVSAIESCLERENHIAYDYVNRPGAVFDDTSFALYCGMVPHLSGWSQAGSSISRNPFQLARFAGKAVDPETDFIQHANQTEASPSSETKIQDNSPVGTNSFGVKTSGQSSLRQRNPFLQFKRLLPNIFGLL